MKVNFFKIGACLAAILLVGVLVGTRELNAQTGGTGASGTPDGPDAIAVRVVPNPNHYSILRWYESQGFLGSPQALVVDGYEAIRDGRTVYVNAANVNPTSKEIYTNIYLISYNQDPLAPTVDILGQLISRWKFNSNLNESSTPTCSFSSVSCAADSDCPDNASCSKTGQTAGSCLLKETKNCLVDTDCPASFFCSSLKSKITRDIKRVGQMEELKQALANFQRINNRYPQLQAGTYLPGQSVSVWPSWSQELLSNLAVSPNFKDPVNRLGPCIPDGNTVVPAGYDPTTCWSATAKKFINEPSGSSLTLPAGSYAFIYSTDTSGNDYELCATMESRPAGYNFSPNDPADSACLVSTGIGSGGLSSNSAPRFVDSQLAGEPNAKFNGYIQVIDPDGDPLTWSWLSAPGHSTVGWTGWVSGGQNSVPPKLLETSSPNQKKVYADRSGSQTGVYQLTLRVTDGRGGVLTTSTPISLSVDPIILEAPSAEYEANPVEYFSYKILFSGNGFSNPSVNTPVLTRISGPFDILSGLSNFTKTYSLVSGKSQVEYRGLIPTSQRFYQDTPISYKVSVTDSYGVTATKYFTILIKAAQPYLSFNCLSEARLGKNYSCQLGPETQGNHNLSYSDSNGYPGGLTISGASGVVSLSGVPTSLSNGQNVTIKVKNEYGASSTKAFNLKVNNFCGDGIWQGPNKEGRGGIYNDGYEDCDGTDRVVNNPEASSALLQYGCSTTAANPSPYPILANNQCVFLSPSAGGGYCGDGYCQARINGVAMETAENCSVDCDGANVQCVASCDGKSCGNDGCGGSCGSCSGGMVCGPTGVCLNAQCGTDSDCDDLNPCSQDICLNAGTTSASCSNNASTGYEEDCVGFTWYDECSFNNGIPTQQPCSTGVCKTKTKRVCVGTVLQSCGSVDPRLAYCETKCEGEPDNYSTGVCLDGQAGVCRGTGNGSACAYMGEVKTCSAVLGWPAGSYIGNASCNDNCTGYDTSSCSPNVCNTINPRSPADCYWYKAPDESVASENKTCMVKMPVKADGSVNCVDQAPIGSSWQWFRGKIHVSATTFCSLSGCTHFVNPNKCRYLQTYWQVYCVASSPQYNPTTCAQYCSDPNSALCKSRIWTNQCYVPINE